MSISRMRQRANDGPVLAALRGTRPVVADLHYRRARGRWLKLATHFGRRVRLQIETLMLRQPTRKEYVNARLGPGTYGSAGRRCRLQRSHVVHPQAKKTNRSSLNRRAPRKQRMSESSRAIHNRYPEYPSRAGKAGRVPEIANQKHQIARKNVDRNWILAFCGLFAIWNIDAWN